MNALEESLVTQTYACKERAEPWSCRTLLSSEIKVEIDMKCCGLCRTEVRVRGDDWGSVD